MGITLYYTHSMAKNGSSTLLLDELQKWFRWFYGYWTGSPFFSNHTGHMFVFCFGFGLCFMYNQNYTHLNFFFLYLKLFIWKKKSNIITPPSSKNGPIKKTFYFL